MSDEMYHPVPGDPCMVRRGGEFDNRATIRHIRAMSRKEGRMNFRWQLWRFAWTYFSDRQNIQFQQFYRGGCWKRLFLGLYINLAK